MSYTASRNSLLDFNKGDGDVTGKGDCSTNLGDYAVSAMPKPLRGSLALSNESIVSVFTDVMSEA